MPATDTLVPVIIAVVPLINELNVSPYVNPDSPDNVIDVACFCITNDFEAFEVAKLVVSVGTNVQ